RTKPPAVSLREKRQNGGRYVEITASCRLEEAGTVACSAHWHITRWVMERTEGRSAAGPRVFSPGDVQAAGCRNVARRRHADAGIHRDVVVRSKGPAERHRKVAAEGADIAGDGVLVAG